MPSKKPIIWVRVTPEEHADILASSDKAGLSLSAFAKRACLGQRIESKVDARAVLDLLKVNADMGRVGGLLKLWLSEPDRHAQEARRLLHELECAKEILVAKINAL